MNRERAYIVRKEVSKRSPSPWPGAMSAFYVIRFNGRKVAEVWSYKGQIKAYFKDGIREQMPIYYIPHEIEKVESTTWTIAFFMLAHAFDRQTAIDWCAKVGVKLLFGSNSRQMYRKSDLFTLILEAQKQAVPLPAAPDA